MTMFRYDPLPRDTGMEEALAARTGDAAWFLARQYALGEFRGDDAASPVSVSLARETHRLDGWRSGVEGEGGEWLPYDPATMVLEELVESEPVTGPDARLTLSGALRWQRALTAAGLIALLPAFARVCPFAADGPLAPTGLSAAVRGRLPDPVALAPWLGRLAERDETAAKEFDAPDSALDALATAAAAWLSWWHAHVMTDTPVGPPKPPPSWNTRRMEYAFEVRASSLPGLELRAEEYHGGHLDWWALDGPVQPLPVSEAAVTRDRRKIVPTPAVYGGMPVSRFWEMEDARIDFGSVDASPADLGRLMLIAFATVYNSDWFCVPLPLPVGSLSRIVDCTVTDVFGGRTTLRHATADDPVVWSLFGLGGPGASGNGGIPPASGMTQPPSPWFYRPAALPAGLESPPVESVLLLRDEQANLAWAVEESVADDADERVDRYDRWVATAPPPAPPPPDGSPRYRVVTEVPSHWYPLVPQVLADQESVRLRLAGLNRGDGSPRPTLGQLLGETGWLYEEEVPRSGVRVERGRQYTRWQDGRTHAWTARSRGSGTGGGSSGLRFDVLEGG
ncbi:hypothetical protein [Streptomyces sp. MBT33]|uniref:hypothetical protein n=1 Tax=Streptomyces sp. MBT33 TaxID=1488363 RepID=UPI00190DE7E4|nr:hypothetical protein [Streptomyces sp. MBT33]MBK3641563.1 hypothetical protein [Streptomyces sp. MBT33]